MLSTILLQQNPNGGGWSGMLMILAMVVIFYFFMIRPQSKKQKEIKKAREAMGKGDKVVTAGGIHGKIREVNGDIITVEIAPNVSIRVDKTSVYPAGPVSDNSAVKETSKENKNNGKGAKSAKDAVEEVEVVKEEEK